MIEQNHLEVLFFIWFCAVITLTFFWKFWNISVFAKNDHRLEASNQNSERRENQTVRSTRVENVTESARNQFESVHQQRLQEYETTILRNENSDLPPSYEESMRNNKRFILVTEAIL